MANGRPAYPPRWRRITRARPGALRLAIAAWAIVVVASGIALLTAQRDSAQQIKDRFGVRVETTATFVQTYIEDMAAAQRRVAQRDLGGTRPNRETFERTAALFGSDAAVLLDGRGRALHVESSTGALTGVDLASRYAHLQAALNGEIGVSSTVRSPTVGAPLMAIAVSFQGESGRRVFSVAYPPGQTPLGSYLRRAGTIAPNHVFLVDEHGTVLGSNATDSEGQRLDQVEPLVAAALAGGRNDGTATGDYFAARDVAGTPWRLITVAPEASLFQTIHGLNRWTPWLIWLGLIGGALLSVVLIARLTSSQRALRASNADLDRLARVDPLTGLVNRRYLEEALDATLAGAARHGHEAAVLMIDVDHFKRINDVYGHAAGDVVLGGLATLLRGALRDGDVVGRWGGEEFVAVLPFTDGPGAEVLAERMRTAIASTLIPAGKRELSVAISIGCAAWRSGEGRDALLHRADAALYQAKERGRNRVVNAEASHEQIELERARFQREPRALTVDELERSAQPPAE